MSSPTYNGLIYNAGLYNGPDAGSGVFSSDTLVFESFSLSDGTTMIMTDLSLSGPTREILGGSVPRDHGQYVNADFFRENVIEASGIVKKSTAAELDAYLDTIKKNLRTREGNLDYIDANGTVKRFVATVDNFDEMFAGRQRHHTTICPWRVRFRCKTPFGRSRNYTSTTIGVTTSPTSQIQANAGTIRALPVFILIFDSASSVTVVNVKRVNSAGTTLEEIEYSGTVSTGDILEFNSESKTVQKNSSAVTYTGGFPTLEPGSNIIKFTVTASSFSATTTLKHKDTYL